MEQNAALLSANGIDVFTWFSSGAGEVSAHRKYLNLINVFPVADGDTGTNLSTTLKAMVSAPLPTRSFSRMLQSLSQSALESAHGNSGIIFASYVNGLALEGHAYERVSAAEFASVAFNAVKHLYRAVEHPVEGTMLSTIRDWAAFLHGNHQRYPDFQQLFSAAYHAAAASMEKTRMQLDVLRRNNVVDSGAAGFVRFLEGINRVFTEGREPVLAEETPTETAPIAVREETTAYRYCTEALVETEDAKASDNDDATDEIRQALRPLGDSLIVARLGKSVKIHIHTDVPDQVMEKLAAFGPLRDQKADDMALQNRLRRTAKGGVGLVTDSIADLPDRFLLENNVTVAPLGVLVQGNAYLDKITIRLPRLFKEMDAAEGYPTTSQPEPGRIRALLAARLEQFDSLIVLSVSSGLSNTYQSFVQAAKALSTPEKPVTVVDTRLNSGAQGLMVKLAADLIRAGATHETIVRAVERRIPQTKIYVCLNTLAYAVRGGRVPDTVGKLGAAVGLRPIMTLDARGHGAAFGAAFSQAGLTRRIMRLARRTLKRKGVEAYGIVHGGNPLLAAEYQEQLTRIVGKPPAFVSEISSAVAIHSGPGTVAVCLTEGKGDS
jgi:uncharacterized protein